MSVATDDRVPIDLSPRRAFGSVRAFTHAYLHGGLRSSILLGLVLPAAYLCFGLGTLLAAASLPRGFDLGRCVISRLGSSRYNPDGYGYLTFGLISVAILLAPFPGWFTAVMRGCPRLGACGRTTFWIGLVASAMIGIERGLFPTHWSRFEVVHLTIAAVAFLGLWLGQMMLVGATELPLVRWRWFWRPPWFLAACVLPILTIFAMYLPLSIMPGAKSRVLHAFPRSLVFLRTPTFWQWYLVISLLASAAMLAHRASRVAFPAPTNLGPWRLDPQPPASRQPGVGEGPHQGRVRAAGVVDLSEVEAISDAVGSDQP